MANLIPLLMVAMVIVLGIGACWAITASGSAAPTATDTFGNRPSADTVTHNNESAGMAVKTMPALFISFFVAICVILAAGVAWFWKTGKSKANRY